MNNFFSDRELIFYKDLSDLSELINKYNKDHKKRRLVAKAGREKYFRYFNSTLLADFIITKTFGHKGKNFYWDSK